MFSQVVSFLQISPPKLCIHFSSLHTLSAQTKTCKRKSRCVFSESHLCRNYIWKLCSKTSCISSGVSFDTCISKKKCVHGCVNKNDLLLITQPRTLRIILLRLKHFHKLPRLLTDNLDSTEMFRVVM